MSTRQIVEVYGMDLEKLWRGSCFNTSTYAYLASALTPFPSVSFLKFYEKNEWNKLTMAMAKKKKNVLNYRERWKAKTWLEL